MCARSNMQERIQAMQKAIANADGASKAFLRQQLAVMDGSMKHGQVDFDNAMDASKRILLEAEQEASGLGDVVGNNGAEQVVEGDAQSFGPKSEYIRKQLEMAEGALIRTGLSFHFLQI